MVSVVPAYRAYLAPHSRDNDRDAYALLSVFARGHSDPLAEVIVTVACHGVKANACVGDGLDRHCGCCCRIFDRNCGPVGYDYDSVIGFHPHTRNDYSFELSPRRYRRVDLRNYNISVSIANLKVF